MDKDNSGTIEKAEMVVYIKKLNGEDEEPSVEDKQPPVEENKPPVEDKESPVEEKETPVDDKNQNKDQEATMEEQAMHSVVDGIWDTYDVDKSGALDKEEASKYIKDTIGDITSS